MNTTTAKGYVAGGQPFLYPSAGDERPPSGAKVLLLTRHGICITGQWANTGHFMGWAPLPKRDRAKEEQASA